MNFKRMKKLLNYGIVALTSLLLFGCSDSENDDVQWGPGSIIGEWVLQKVELYNPQGALKDSFECTDPADRYIAIFNEDGTFRYYDYPPEEYYEGTYTYDERTLQLEMFSPELPPADSQYTFATVDFSGSTMRWTSETDEAGYYEVAYYMRK